MAEGFGCTKGKLTNYTVVTGRMQNLKGKTYIEKQLQKCDWTVPPVGGTYEIVLDGIVAHEREPAAGIEAESPQPGRDQRVGARTCSG
jgi:hypothetical protein